MGLLKRKPRPIARSELTFRDDRIFVVACDDTYAPAQYFDALREPRVKVIVLPAPDQKSAPGHVVSNLLKQRQAMHQEHELLAGDEFWVLLDTDHNIGGAHQARLVTALNDARQNGLQVAMSHPCFEMWLLFHHEELAAGVAYTKGEQVCARLRTLLGSFNKLNIPVEHFSRERIPTAIARSRAREAQPDDPVGYWPEHNGSRVYRLLERILASQKPA